MKTDIDYTVLTGTDSRLMLAPAIRRVFFPVVTAALLLAFVAPCSAAKKKPPVKHAAPAPVVHPAVHKISDSRLAPIPSSDKVVSYHAPYDAGDCSICHQSNDAQNPGPIKGKVNELCMSCHDNFQQTMARKYVHYAAQDSCVNCHNPHDSLQPKLLLEQPGKLCLGCHDQIKELAGMTVKHDALTEGKQCVNCHNPHGSEVEHLLVQLPMQLCMQCHTSDKLEDHNGKKLVNMGKLLADNPHQHGPVAAQDCSACHMPHGSNNFRLLTNAYPPQFYSGYDSKNYALCFGCHDEQAFTKPETQELTQFRDGKKNLHYVHVNRSEVGRTCRACHDVHASAQEHQIRDAVPFGPKGWPLKINYTKTESGGYCAKTCHSKRSYNNSRINASAPAAAPEAKDAPQANSPAPAAPEAKTAASATEPTHDAKP